MPTGLPPLQLPGQSAATQVPAINTNALQNPSQQPTLANPYAGMTFGTQSAQPFGLLATSATAQKQSNTVPGTVGARTFMPQAQTALAAMPVQTVGINEIGMANLLLGPTNPVAMSAAQLKAFLPENRFQMMIPGAVTSLNGAANFIPPTSNLMSALPTLLTPGGVGALAQQQQPQIPNPLLNPAAMTAGLGTNSSQTVTPKTESTLKNMKQTLTQMIAAMASGKLGKGATPSLKPNSTSSDPFGALMAGLSKKAGITSPKGKQASADYSKELALFGHSTPIKPFKLWRGKPEKALHNGFYVREENPKAVSTKKGAAAKPSPKITFEVFTNSKGGRSVRHVDKDGKPIPKTPVINYAEWVKDQWGKPQVLPDVMNNTSMDKAFKLTRRPPKSLDQLPYGFYISPGFPDSTPLKDSVFEKFWDPKTKTAQVRNMKGATISLEKGWREGIWFKPEAGSTGSPKKSTTTKPVVEKPSE